MTGFGLLLILLALFSRGHRSADRPVTLEKRSVVVEGRTFSLNVISGYDVVPVASGMHRIRFMAWSPDGRLFLADMMSKADNNRGKLYVLDSFDVRTQRFRSRKTYLEQLRNPNSVAFYHDKQGRDWIYVALTDRLVRYRYRLGEDRPSSPAEILDRYPDSGSDYRKGGWHLTRTIAFGSNGKLYVSVGSSCNSCLESEEVRASIVEMEPDGSKRRIFARGLRNAVGLEWAPDGLYATNMGVDHLGRSKPDDALYKVKFGDHFGWPYFSVAGNKVAADPEFASESNKMRTKLSKPAALLGAHAAPLGLVWMDSARTSDERLRDAFLVALHGSYSTSLGRGYSVVRVEKGKKPVSILTGFLDGHTIHGRPCGLSTFGRDRLLISDDHFGVLYMLYRR